MLEMPRRRLDFEIFHRKYNGVVMQLKPRNPFVPASMNKKAGKHLNKKQEQKDKPIKEN